MGLDAGREGESAGTARCCDDCVEGLRDQNEDFRTSGVEGELLPLGVQGEVEARFAVVNDCITETPLARSGCSMVGEGSFGRNECVLLVFRNTFSVLLFGKDANATELIREGGIMGVLW